jgi:hypothetical protein
MPATLEALAVLAFAVTPGHALLSGYQKEEVLPPVYATGYLDSPMSSILDRCPYSPRRKRSYVVRLFFDDQTVDLDLPEQELSDPRITLRELIARYGSPR